MNKKREALRSKSEEFTSEDLQLRPKYLIDDYEELLKKALKHDSNSTYYTERHRNQEMIEFELLKEISC